jgi:hypothetical protein
MLKVTAWPKKAEAVEAVMVTVAGSVRPSSRTSQGRNLRANRPGSGASSSEGSLLSNQAIADLLASSPFERGEPGLPVAAGEERRVFGSRAVQGLADGWGVDTIVILVPDVVER